MKKILLILKSNFLALSLNFKTRFTKVPETFTAGVNMVAHNNPRPKYSYILPPKPITTLSGSMRI